MCIRLHTHATVWPCRLLGVTTWMDTMMRSAPPRTAIKSLQRSCRQQQERHMGVSRTRIWLFTCSTCVGASTFRLASHGMRWRPGCGVPAQVFRRVCVVTNATCLACNNKTLSGKGSGGWAMILWLFRLLFPGSGDHLRLFLL